jgi:hypothetical protein
VRNEEVLQRVEKEKEKGNCVGHNLRGKYFPKHVTEGNTVGKIVVT